MSSKRVTPFGLQVLPDLVTELLKPEKTILDEQLRSLLERNAEKGNPPVGFFTRGKFHTNKKPKEIPADQKRHIHIDLIDEAIQYTEACRAMEADQVHLTTGLAVALRHCNSYQDIRDALPDTLKFLHPELESLPRIRPEGWSLPDSDLYRTQFEQTIELAVNYFASRLLN